MCSSPGIGADGTIYAGTFDGYLAAVSPSGVVVWRYSTGNMIQSSPAIGSNGTIYVSADAGGFYAFNPNGTLKFTFASNGPCSPSIAADGTVYTSNSTDAKFYAIK